jgi:iron complex transport system substrate-binding protein
VDPIAKAEEIFEKLLGVNPYAELKEAGYEFRPIQIGA